MSRPVWNSLVIAFRRLIRSEDGSMTILGLFICLCIAMVCGIAIDAARLQTRTVLMQNAADSAAHGALITRRTASASSAIERAIAIAQGHMAPSSFGTVLTSADVQFGTWDSETRAFTPDANATNAVHVTTRQTRASGNPFLTSLLRLVGIQEWDVTRSSVFRNTAPPCQRQGIISQGEMTFSSQNSFYQPICLHSNTSFEASTSNSFETGVGVSVPDPKDVKVNAGHNPGFDAALSYRTMDVMSMIRTIPDIISGLTTPGSSFIPSYITNQDVLNITSISSDQFEVKAGQLTSGRIYRATCNPNGTTKPQTIVIKPNVVISQVAIVTNCTVRFESDVRLEDAVVATSNSSSSAITGAAGVILGKNDDCASGGGAQLVTSGGVVLNSTLSIYGSQILAQKDIHIDAQTNGTVGLSITAGGKFTNTSLATWRACPETNIENTYQNLYIARLVQ